MKKLYIVIGIVALICSLNAQNQIDPPKLADYTNTAVFDRSFGLSHFIKGWNWGESYGRRLDDALSINYNHRGFWRTSFGSESNSTQQTLTSSDFYGPNQRLLVQLPQNLVGFYGANATFNAQAVTFFPVIDVDSTNNFQPRANDNSGSVFGFFTKNKIRTESNPASGNYHFALLDKDSVTSEPITVLDNAWGGN